MNRTRTFFLMVLLTILFVVIGGAVGGREGSVMAFLFAAAMNFFSYWFSDKMILKRYAASQVGPEDQSRLYGIVAELVAKGRFAHAEGFRYSRTKPECICNRPKSGTRSGCSDRGVAGDS